MIRAIAIMDAKQGIAASGSAPNNIPWNIPADKQHFRQLTNGSAIVMGRGTYETFDEPLPGRRNVVVSRSIDTVRPGFELIKDIAKLPKNEDLWVIGGAQIYTAMLDVCDELYITHVAGDFNCDRFFPEFADNFMLQSKSAVKKDGDYSFYFAVYTKKPANT